MNTNDYKLSSIITTVRHGHKNELGELTEEGIAQAKNVGEKLHYVRGETHIFHSGMSRVEETVETLYKSKNQQIKHLSIYESHYLHFLHDAKSPGSFVKKWKSKSGNKNTRMDWFLAQGSQSEEPDIYPSPKKMAARLARVILTQIDFCTITIPEIMTNFINGTHEPVVMAFVYYILNAYNPTFAEGVTEELGGSIDFVEGFNILVYQAENKPTVLKFTFRDNSFELDQDELREFAVNFG